ncbi:MAG TPA: DUF1634 domain-containing protein [Kofleriaceae bacterium]
MSLERQLARLLAAGTIAGTIVVAIGFALVCGDVRAGVTVETIGIVAFVALPIARVAVMLVAFARLRDRKYALIAALVLAVIGTGAWLGLHVH